MKTLEERISHLEKLHNVFKEKLEEPENGTMYWYLDNLNDQYKSCWNNDNTDKARLKAGNVFWKKSDCDDGILRRESMANRITEPKKNDEVWYWNFDANKVICVDYDRAWLPDWFIGAFHTSEENCKEWHKKYGKAFENLSSSK